MKRAPQADWFYYLRQLIYYTIYNKPSCIEVEQKLCIQIDIFVIDHHCSTFLKVIDLIFINVTVNGK